MLYVAVTSTGQACQLISLLNKWWWGPLWVEVGWPEVEDFQKQSDWCGCIACIAVSRCMIPWRLWQVLPIEPVSSMWKSQVHDGNGTLMIWLSYSIGSLSTTPSIQASQNFDRYHLIWFNSIRCRLYKLWCRWGDWSIYPEDARQHKRFGALAEKKYASRHPCGFGERCEN